MVWVWSLCRHMFCKTELEAGSLIRALPKWTAGRPQISLLMPFSPWNSATRRGLRCASQARVAWCAWRRGRLNCHRAEKHKAAKMKIHTMCGARASARLVECLKPGSTLRRRLKLIRLYLAYLAQDYDRIQCPLITLQLQRMTDIRPNSRNPRCHSMPTLGLFPAAMAALRRGRSGSISVAKCAVA